MSENSDALLNDNEGNIENYGQNIDISEFPKIMYVDSIENLRVRSEPSIHGNINGLLLFGTRIIIREKSEMVDTIDEISSYWYRIGDYRNRDGWVSGWVFGGYISEEFPSHLPIILGKWDNVNSEIAFGYFIEAISFLPDNEFRHSFRKETSDMIWGDWELLGETIKIYNIKIGLDNNGIISDPDEIKLRIIDKNNMVLAFSNNRIVEYRRSDDFW
jgi:hypothetical protein